MDEAELQSRLSRISTMWTLLGEAHAVPKGSAQAALAALIERYQGAAYRYLLGAVRNPDVADELFQEFALKLTQGAFRSADPQRGRFRDYLKSTLYHLAVDHQKRQRKAYVSLDEQVAEPAAGAWDPDQADEQFVQHWRDEILAKAWAALRAGEGAGGQPYFSVLKFRAEHPGASSAEMAARLSEQLRPETPFTETGIRKTLQRARTHFAEALVAEVARSLGDPTDDELEDELIAIGLLDYCRSAFHQRRNERSLEPRSGT